MQGIPAVYRPRKKELRALEKSLGVRFRRIGYLQWALQHRSYVNENPDLHLSHNERLEFLGDSVLGLFIAQILYEKFPKFSEGKLTLVKSSLVNMDTLAQMASEMGLGNFLLLGKGEARGGGRKRASILGDALEAVIAAFYLDRGVKPAFKLIRRLFGAKIEAVGTRPGHIDNPKNLLQKFTQNRFGVLPEYRVAAEMGPQHRKIFHIEVRVQEKDVGKGSGATKKKAEEAAAQDALRHLQHAT